jgi:hypothetical protein
MKPGRPNRSYQIYDSSSEDENIEGISLSFFAMTERCHP